MKRCWSVEKQLLDHNWTVIFLCFRNGSGRRNHETPSAILAFKVRIADYSGT